MPNLWLELDLTGAKKFVLNSFISKCVNRSKQQLRSAVLVRLSKPDAVLQALTTKCHAMHSLTCQDLGLQSGPFVSRMAQATRLTNLVLGENTVVGTDALEQLLILCPRLKVLECHSVIGFNRPSHQSWTVDLPNLEELTVIRKKEMTPGADLSLVRHESES